MVVELQSVSDKALAYMGKDALKHKVLVIYELGGIGRPGSDALEMVKQGMSEDCIRRQIAESTYKGVRPKLVEVDGPVNVWTTTRVKTDYELNNRVFELTTDDSRDQTQQILERVFADDRPRGLRPRAGSVYLASGPGQPRRAPFRPCSWQVATKLVSPYAPGCPKGTQPDLRPCRAPSGQPGEG